MVHVLFVLYKNPPKSFLMYVIVIQTEAISRVVNLGTTTKLC